MIELVVAIAIVGATLVSAVENIFVSPPPQATIPADGFSMLRYVPWITQLTIVFPLVAAIYVFVRGLDNIGEGLREYPRAYAVWKEFFPTPEESVLLGINRLTRDAREKEGRS